VLRALSACSKALVQTSGMVLVVVYLHAVVGFLAFPNNFQLRKAEIVDGATQMPWENHRRVPCSNVWTCMAVILDVGLRSRRGTGEDLGFGLASMPWPTKTVHDDCRPCLRQQVGITCPQEKHCLEGNGNLNSWPQARLWIR
jgi:hypothetical protein